MNADALNVLLEDNHCLAINKPAGLLSMGDETGDESAADLVRSYLREKYHKPGNVFVGVVHRLDRPVSGVLLFARTSKAASRLADQFRRGKVRKTYCALVSGCVQPESGRLVDWLIKNRERNHVSVVTAKAPDAKRAEMSFRVLGRPSGRTLLEIIPVTGRSHQIRVQLAQQGHPIVGDVRYGSRKDLHGRIALHATQLEFEHPTKREPVIVSSNIPEFE